MEHLTDPSLGTFLLQALLLPIYIPLSYLAYRWALVPQKRSQVQQALLKLKIEQKEEDLEKQYRFKHYAWPLFLAYVLTLGIYTTTHPYIIKQGLWVGIIEEMIDIFGSQNPFPRAITVGRFLFWGWMGAYIYSVNLTFRRFLDFDLTPSVYIFTATRFFLAMTVGAIVGVGLGTFLTSSGVSFNMTLMMVSITSFVIGFFPQIGINWITTTAKKFLRQHDWQASNEKPLSEISGLSFWQQGRLNQIGIESVENLAAADIPHLIINTPYKINQIISWVDQAILRKNTTKDEFIKLKEVSAWSLLENMSTNEKLRNLAEATGVTESRLKQLSTSLQSPHENMEFIIRFRLQEKLSIVKIKKDFQEGKLILDEGNGLANTPGVAPVTKSDIADESQVSKSNSSEVTEDSSQYIDDLLSDNDTPKISLENNQTNEKKSPKINGNSSLTDTDSLKLTSINKSDSNKLDEVLKNRNSTKLPQNVNSLEGQQIVNYQLIRLSRKGYMDASYYGQDLRNQRKVIIKVINPLLLNNLSIFNQEGQFISQLKHPNVTTLEEYGETNDFLYLSRQYVRGLDLIAALNTCQKEKKSVTQLISRVIRGVCNALDYTHDAGVIHRNVKASNIVVNSAEGQGILTDFGLSFLTGIGVQSEILSSPYYIAPEQVEPPAKAVNETDFYALGIILYKVFTGYYPFDVGGPSDTVLQHLTKSPPTPNINPELKNVIFKALERSPEDRYQKGKDFADALDQALQVTIAKE